MTARLYIGTSSWAEKGLDRFYPPQVKDSQSRLAYFARHFNLAEIDSTYYALPSAKNMARWAAAVPQGFLFDVKAFALFTQHPTNLSSIPKGFREALPPEAGQKARLYYKDLPSDIREELWRIFSGALRPLREAGKLGAIILDFPPWFVPSEANRRYIAEASEHLAGDPLVVEFRNRLWVKDEAETATTFAFLCHLGVGFVCVDEPPGLPSAFPPVVAVTAPITSVRFRGRNAARWDDKGASIVERLNWWYSDEELAEWLPRLRQLASEAQELHIVFNTKFEDQSVVNAQRLQRQLAEAL